MRKIPGSFEFSLNSLNSLISFCERLNCDWDVDHSNCISDANIREHHWASQNVLWSSGSLHAIVLQFRYNEAEDKGSFLRFKLLADFAESSHGS
jgi:hypothetical protein